MTFIFSLFFLLIAMISHKASSMAWDEGDYFSSGVYLVICAVNVAVIIGATSIKPLCHL